MYMLAHIQICKFILKILFWNAEVFFSCNIISDIFLRNLFEKPTERVQFETVFIARQILYGLNFWIIVLEYFWNIDLWNIMQSL